VSERRVGIDVGGSKLLGVAVTSNSSAEVIAQSVVPTPSTSEEVIDAIVSLATMLEADHGVGVGLAGLVEGGAVLRAAPNLKCMIDVPVRDLLSQRLGIPVSIENDATCALVAEMAVGCAQEHDDVVLVTLGTGIGGGVAIDGKIHRGAHGFSGEPGHMSVDPDGPECVCGRRGCWERYASGAGVVWLAQRRGLDADPSGAPITSNSLVALARNDDEQARAVWDEFADWLAVGLANIADVLDPALFVIGGGLVEVADLYFDRTQDRFFAEVLGGRARARTQLALAHCGPAAGAIGAALLN